MKEIGISMANSFNTKSARDYLGIMMFAVLISTMAFGFESLDKYVYRSELAKLNESIYNACALLFPWVMALLVVKNMLVAIRFAISSALRTSIENDLMLVCFMIVMVLIIQQGIVPGVAAAQGVLYEMSFEAIMEFDLVIIVAALAAIMTLSSKIMSSVNSGAYHSEIKRDEGQFLSSGVVRSENSKTKVTETELKLITQHEAGHMMMFSLLTELPPQLSARIGGKDRGRSLGCIEHSIAVDKINSKSTLHFEMLVLLAGIAAEKIVGHHGLGGDGDMAQWYTAARKYLSLGDNGYIPVTENELEVQHNSTILTALKEEHLALLSSFIERNRTQFDSISKELGEHRVLSRSQIEFLLAPINVENMPGFTINFDPKTQTIKV